MTDLTIRELTPPDGPDLAHFFESNQDEATARYFHPFPLNSATAHRLLEQPCANRYLGGWLEGRLVAFSMLRGWDEGWLVPSLGILLDGGLRRRGLGRAVVQRTLDLAVEIGSAQVRLTVYASNAGALRLFETAGFVEQSRSAVGIDDRADSRILMLWTSKRGAKAGE